MNKPPRTSNARRNSLIVIISAILGSIPLLTKSGCHFRADFDPVHARTNQIRLTNAVKVLLLAAVLLTGCSSFKIEDRQRGVEFSAITPAWPWQDSQRAIERFTLSARGTNFSASMRGLSESEITTTNFADVAERLLGAAIRAARP